MSTYDHTITLAVPLADYDIATLIGRAFDPDTGGAESFAITRATDSNGVIYAVTNTPCTAEFSAQSQYILANPATLNAAITADYATRWPDLTKPTVAQVERFASIALLVVDGGLDEALESVGLTRVLSE